MLKIKEDKMQELEIFVVVGSITAKDRETNDYLEIEDAVELLNEQSKHIKELESKLRVSNSLNASLSLDYNELKKRYDSEEKLLFKKLAENSTLTLENQQLKQSQKQLAISILENILSTMKKQIEKSKDRAFQQIDYLTFKPVIDYTKGQIKELGGGENECENRVVKH